MKHRIRRIFSVLITLTLLLSCLPMAVAAEDAALWVSPIADETLESERPVAAVKWWYDEADATYYIFLPTACDAAKLQLWLDGAESCTVDGTVVASGAETAALTVGKHTVVLGGATYPVAVMQSSNIGTMYITTESGNMDYIHKKKGNKEAGYMKMLDADGDVVYDNKIGRAHV